MSKRRQKRQTTTGALGNTPTKAACIKTEAESRSWRFTWNNYTSDDITSVISYFVSGKDTKYVFQEETGEEGTPHLQGCFRASSAIKFITLKNTFPKASFDRVNKWEGAVDYCKKTFTRTGKTFTNIEGLIVAKPKRAIKNGFKDEQATLWQKLILWCASFPPEELNRYIIWIYDEYGKSGKSVTAREAVLRNPYNVMYVCGASKDAKCALASFLDGKDNDLYLALFDIPRTSQDYVSYAALEEFCNGICFSTKYESKALVFNWPWIIVLANFLPDKSALSSDRWKIFDISECDITESQYLNITEPYIDA